MRVLPMVVTTDLPGSAGTDLNDRPCLVMKSLARSQSENLLHGPTKMWNWQSVAATVIGVFAEYSSSPGLLKCVSHWNSRKHETAAIRQPVRTIWSGPLLAASQPQTIKSGVPRRSDTQIRI